MARCGGGGLGTCWEGGKASKEGFGTGRENLGTSWKLALEGFGPRWEAGEGGTGSEKKR